MFLTPYEVIFVVMGKFKFSESSWFVFLIRVLSVIIAYFANSIFVVLCLRVSVVCSSWLRECSFSLTICRQGLRDLIAVLICLAKVLFVLANWIRKCYSREFILVLRLKEFYQCSTLFSSFALGIGLLSICTHLCFKIC